MSGYQRRDRGGGLPYPSRRSMSGAGYGGGGHQRGYRPTTAPPRSHVVNPWESGVVPMAGTMRGSQGDGYQHSSGGRYNQDIDGSINQLNQMGNQESEIALNILNAVLNTSGLDTGNQDRMSWGDEPRPSKMRRVDWGDGYENQQRWMGPGMQQGARKMPGQAWGRGARRGWGYSRNTFSGQDRRKLTAKKGNFNTGGKNQNAQKKKKDTPAAGKAPVKNQKKKPDAPAGEGATDQKKKDDAPNMKAAGAESTTTDTKEDLKKETNTDTKQSETTDAVSVEKETGDDGEKGNQNKADTTAEGKENVSNVTEAGNDDQNKDKNDTLPVEVLKCHICVKNFKTTNLYRYHLAGKNHIKLARVHMEKNDSILNLLKSQSKLASQQNIVSLSKSSGKITVCHKCECPIKGGKAFHNPLRQHTLVVNINRCSTCKMWFERQGKLDNHRLTLQHLKNQHDFEKRIEQRNLERAEKMKTEYDFPEMAVMNKIHDAVDQIILANFNSQAWNPRMISPYDPAIPIGLNFIQRNPQFYCTICSKKILHTAKSALSHFRSQKHYENYLSLLKYIEKKEKKPEDEENQADNDPKPAVNEEMEVSEELVSLNEALEEVGESFTDLSESKKETLDSPEQQSQQDEKPSESSEVEASATTPSESDSNKQPTEKDIVDPKSTEKDTVDPKSTEKDIVDPKSTEMETEIPKSTENKTEIPSQVEEESDTPQANQEGVTLPSSESESPKKETVSKLSTSTPAEKSKGTARQVKSKSVARPVKSKKDATTAETEDTASTTSTKIEATEKTAVEKKIDITPPRTPRATAKRGRGRGKGGKIKAAKN